MIFLLLTLGMEKGGADPAFPLLSPANPLSKLPSLLSSVNIIFFPCQIFGEYSASWVAVKSRIPLTFLESRTVFCSIPGSREYTLPVKSTQQCQTITRAHLSLTSKLSCKIRAFSSAASLNFVFDSMGTFSVR